MSDIVFTGHLVMATKVFLLISVPPLAAALVVGLVVSVLQAATQVQDSTLPQVFKLFAAFAVLIAFSPLLVGSVVELGERVFSDFVLLVP